MRFIKTRHLALWILLLLPTQVMAKPFDSSVCFQDKSEKLNLYRDDIGRVRCAHFGRGRVVEYSYAVQDQEIDGKKYVRGALIGKRFHGMKHLEMNGTIFGPKTPEFQDGLIQEILFEINKIKTLPTIIQEFYPSAEQRQLLIQALLKDQKLSEELNPDWLKDLERISISASSDFFQKRSERKTHALDSDGESSIVSTLTTNFNNQVSVQQCNEFTFDSIAMRVVAGVVGTTNFSDDTNQMGETWVVEKRANIFLIFHERSPDVSPGVYRAPKSSVVYSKGHGIKKTSPQRVPMHVSYSLDTEISICGVGQRSG